MLATLSAKLCSAVQFSSLQTPYVTTALDWTKTGPCVCSDVTVLVLDRPRHKDIIQQCRAAGARIRLISDGDVGGAIEVAKAGTPVDMLVGIGGTPEGVTGVMHWLASMLTRTQRMTRMLLPLWHSVQPVLAAGLVSNATHTWRCWLMGYNKQFS